MVELNADGELIGGFIVDFSKELGFVGGFDIQLVPLTDPELFVNPIAVSVRSLEADLINLGFGSSSVADVPPGYIGTLPMIVIPNVVLKKRCKLHTIDSG